MNKKLSISIMTRSKLKNQNKNPTIGNKISYQKQRNLCVKLLKQTKNYNNLPTTNIVDNKKLFYVLSFSNIKDAYINVGYKKVFRYIFHSFVRFVYNIHSLPNLLNLGSKYILAPRRKGVESKTLVCRTLQHATIQSEINVVQQLLSKMIFSKAKRF